MFIKLVIFIVYSGIMETETLKKGPENIYAFIRENTTRALTKLLDKMGRLNADFDSKPLLNLLKHENEKIRSLAVKNLAKLGDSSLIHVFVNIIENYNSSLVRREAASAIGRLRDSSNKQILFKYLNDPDPEVILQAMRGLLVFKEDKGIQEKLQKLANHPNEIIQDIIKKEFDSNSSSGFDPSHVKSPDFMKNTVVHGDVRNILKVVPDESIHLTFTSPPYYNARDYSILQIYGRSALHLIRHIVQYFLLSFVIK
jgi:hypothetical protein